MKFNFEATVLVKVKIPVSCGTLPGAGKLAQELAKERYPDSEAKVLEVREKRGQVS